MFNKDMLARKFYEGIEQEQDPEPEAVEEVLDEELASGPAEALLSKLGDDAGDDDGDDLVDLRVDDLDEDLDDELDGEFSGDAADGPEAWGVTLSGTNAASDAKLPKPFDWIKEGHKRAVQRAIETLANYGIGIENVDDRGNSLDDDQFDKRRTSNRWAERWWKYNPNGPWAEEFGTLLNTYGVNGTELVAFMALRDLLEDMRGTPHQKALQSLLDKMMACVPPALREQAIEQSRAYRHSVGNTAKYLKKAEHLDRWYAAALYRQQVKVEYTTPGMGTRARHLAALSTVFHREENSLYLLGSEKTDNGWGPVRQWKFDRVETVAQTGLPNPRLAEIPAHPLVRAAHGSQTIERLDHGRVYDYSSGAWLQIDAEPRRLEVVVRVPDVGQSGMPDEIRQKLQSEARRRAYGWMMWCQEKPFHPRQTAAMETLPNGEQQLRLVVEQCYVTEMSSRLLRLQDCFEVIEPPELVVLLRQYAGAISAGHGGKP